MQEQPRISHANEISASTLHPGRMNAPFASLSSDKTVKRESVNVELLVNIIDNKSPRLKITRAILTMSADFTIAASPRVANINETSPQTAIQIPTEATVRGARIKNSNRLVANLHTHVAPRNSRSAVDEQNSPFFFRRTISNRIDMHDATAH